MPWHLIKGIKAWEAKPTGYPPGSIPSSYQKHKSSKQFNFPILEVFWPELTGLFLGKRTLLKCLCLHAWEAKGICGFSYLSKDHLVHLGSTQCNQSLPDPASVPRKPILTVLHIHTHAYATKTEQGQHICLNEPKHFRVADDRG